MPMLVYLACIRHIFAFLRSKGRPAFCKVARKRGNLANESLHGLMGGADQA
jgi:hypothetical protein